VRNGGMGKKSKKKADVEKTPEAPIQAAPMVTPAEAPKVNPSSQPYEQLFIAISGLIGAGKTTLAKALAETMGLPAYYEPVADNEYLADFYADQKTFAFPLQIYLLNARFRQHQQIIWSGRGGVSDRSIYEDQIFAKILKDQVLLRFYVRECL